MDILGTGSNIVLIVLGFGLLIALHELGHFLAARWAGIRADGFAIGMGPVVVSFRKGVGVRFGSCDEVVKARTGRLPIQMSDRELADAGLGETEYSLRLLPIGGYVKMLGQEDGNPAATSSDPRSYGQTPIGRRMVVVSAGVVMNIITAIVMFVIAFLVGVRFEAPVVGGVVPESPAATAVATNGDATGLQAGDLIVRIDGTPVLTFSDIMIESAMSVPEQPLQIEVERPGVEGTLDFEVEPRFEESADMRMIGVFPASSPQLADDPVLIAPLTRMVGAELAAQLPGRPITTAAGAPVDTWASFEEKVDAARGLPVEVVFGPHPQDPGSSPIETTLAATPRLQIMPDPASELGPEYGLLGLVPLVRIEDVPVGGRNADVVRVGDLVLKVGDLSAPGMNEFRAAIRARPGQSLSMIVLRDGVETPLEVRVDADGLIGVLPGHALDLPVTAAPLSRTGDTTADARPTPIATLGLLPRTRIDAVAGLPVEDWASMRAALIAATADAASAGGPATVEITTTLPLPDAAQETATIMLEPTEVASLHDLGWTSPLPSTWFEPLQTTLTAHGNPLVAVSMGFRQTWRMIVLTYLTIDRLVGGSVSVKQLHGPVGIVHIGTKVADRGAMYLLFFLAMISVNLAVLNFLPLPIVDGGLFLFLVYEKIRGRPPSIAFQNAAAIIGLALIGTLFVVTFFNDVMRLTGGG